MSKKDTRTPEERELEMMKDHDEREKYRREENITRGELLDAIDGLKSQYGASGTHESQLISEAFEYFASLLR